MIRAALRALAAGALLCGLAAAQGQPLPVERTATLKEENGVWYVDGRQRLPSNVTLTILRRGRIVGRGEGAVLEVEGGLDLRAVTGGEVVIEDLWIEPWPGCKGLTLLNCRFQGDGGLRTAKERPAKTDIVLRNSKFKGKAELDLGLSGGQVSIMNCGFDAQVGLRGESADEKKPPKLEAVMVGCTGRELGFRGGLRLEGLREALLRNVDLAGDESTFADCRKLIFDGNHARSTRVEFRQSKAKSFGGIKISNTDFRCKELVLFQPATNAAPQKVKLDHCWFGDRTEPEEIKAELLEDAERDELSGVLATFAKIQESPLGFGGRP